MSQSDVFDHVIEAPDPELRDRYQGLIGIDHPKSRIHQEAILLFAPGRLMEWSRQHYGEVLRGVTDIANRTPLMIFGGDVGTGKTALATSFPDTVARALDAHITVFHLGLASRGQGAVGEMTKRLGTAFSQVVQHARHNEEVGSSPAHAAVLVIDEADSVAQSRDLDQMHHEDRAGVNAIIRGIDSLSDPSIAAICIMCTNRLEAIDPAVHRRAALSLTFARPTKEQRQAVLEWLLGSALQAHEYEKLAQATGAKSNGGPMYTFSDLRSRLVPAILRRALNDGPVTVEMALEATEELEPTTPFAGIDGNP